MGTWSQETEVGELGQVEQVKPSWIAPPPRRPQPARMAPIPGGLGLDGAQAEGAGLEGAARCPQGGAGPAASGGGGRAQGPDRRGPSGDSSGDTDRGDSPSGSGRGPWRTPPSPFVPGIRPTWPGRGGKPRPGSHLERDPGPRVPDSRAGEGGGSALGALAWLGRGPRLPGGVGFFILLLSPRL